MKRVTAACLALAVLTSAGGCSVLPGDTGTYRLTAYFAKAPSLYEKSRVQVMGSDVGSITDISVDGDGTRVRVQMTVDANVPLPADVHAAVVSANTLGERNIVLWPPWKPGLAKAAPGAVIPQQRTELPVEVDEALAAFDKLNEAIDPDQLGRLAKSGADGLEGHGGDINSGLRATANLADGLAGQDEKLVRLAGGLRTLAADLNRKDRQLTGTIKSFSEASRMLAAERADVQRFLAGLAEAMRESGTLITAYEETLPGTVADVSNIVLTLKTNSASLNEAVLGLSKFVDAAIEAWDPKRHVATVRILVHATARAWLQPLFDAMGWGRVPCLDGDKAVANCGAAGR